MFFVVQDNIRSEPEHENLMAQLERQKVSHQLVKVVPFSHEIVPDIKPKGPVYVNGTMTLGKIARDRGWTPGYFDKNLDYSFLERYGRKELLNFDFEICTLRAALDHPKFKNKPAFLRPVADDKAFAGTLMNPDDRLKWLSDLEKIEGDPSNPTVTLKDLTIIATPKKILREYRFFIVNGKVVTGSLYKMGSRVTYSNEIDRDVFWYASWCADRWNPDQAYALDIADTPDGNKVLETNSINSSGFYACDMGKYVAAIETLGNSSDLKLIGAENGCEKAVYNPTYT